MKFYFCCLPPLDFPLAFLGSPVWVAAGPVTLIPGPCLLVRIPTQRVSFPARHPAYTSLLDPLWWHASIPASGQGFHTRPKDIQSVVSTYLPESNSLSTAQSPGTGALCPACHCLALCPWAAHFPPLSQILLHRLKACDQPTLGAAPSFGILQSTTIPLTGHPAGVWSQSVLSLFDTTSTFWVVFLSAKMELIIPTFILFFKI